jgi:hypothetical protein
LLAFFAAENASALLLALKQRRRTHFSPQPLYHRQWYGV